MAAPVISASSSILGFKRNEQFEFQPAATNNPTSWAAVGLPNGVTINSSTGKISGSASTAGVYVVTVSATNADPTPGTREFVIGIASETASDASASTDALVLTVTLPGGAVASNAVEASGIGSGSGGQTGGGQAAGLFSVKAGDTRLLIIRFVDASGNRLDPNPATLKFTLKELEPDGVLVTASDFQKIGSDSSAEFNLPLALTGPVLDGALSNYEADSGTSFLALGEIEWTRNITHNSAALTLRTTTPTFRVAIDRDLTANA